MSNKVKETQGCTNHGCWVVGNLEGGVYSNSICKCLQVLPLVDRIAVERQLSELRNLKAQFALLKANESYAEQNCPVTLPGRNWGARREIG